MCVTVRHTRNMGIRQMDGLTCEPDYPSDHAVGQEANEYDHRYSDDVFDHLFVRFRVMIKYFYSIRGFVVVSSSLCLTYIKPSQRARTYLIPTLTVRLLYPFCRTLGRTLGLLTLGRCLNSLGALRRFLWYPRAQMTGEALRASRGRTRGLR